LTPVLCSKDYCRISPKSFECICGESCNAQDFDNSLQQQQSPAQQWRVTSRCERRSWHEPLFTMGMLIRIGIS
jgi:hypothetical protein